MQNRKRDTEVWNRLLDSVGEGEGGMFQDNSIETCIFETEQTFGFCGRGRGWDVSRQQHRNMYII